MDDLDKRILTAIQADLPLQERPFDALAAALGVQAGEVVRRVRRFLESRLVRRLGPVFDSRCLGYASTLVAAKVPADRLEDVAARVSRLPGVTHNYERPGTYNLWFTLTAASADDLDRTLETLRRETGLADLHSLPALAVYKIHVAFDLTGDPPRAPDEPADRRRPSPAVAALSDEQKRLVRLLQDGLPARPEPFAAIAKALGWPAARVIEQVREWLRTGVVRRFGAVVSHRELGYRANGMAVFRAPAAGADQAGGLLAEFPEVSHCYRRPPLPDFPYNLYAMVHGHSEEEVRRTVAQMAGETGLAPFDVLFSSREFKKVSMRYFEEDAPG